MTRRLGILALILLASSCSSAHPTASQDAQTTATADSAALSFALSLTPAPVPADMLNPDVTPATIHTTICARGWTSRIRPSASYVAAIKRTQIRVYGYADRRLSSYQEDHAIPLELGGVPNVRANLWPEPLTRARSDDAIENSLRAAVCRGEIGLTDAQQRVLAVKVAHGYARDRSLQ